MLEAIADRLQRRPVALDVPARLKRVWHPPPPPCCWWCVEHTRHVLRAEGMEICVNLHGMEFGEWRSALCFSRR